MFESHEPLAQAMALAVFFWEEQPSMVDLI
jgi:hypothetical protein